MGRLLLLGAQLPHTILPQRRQWCRRKSKVNLASHSMQCDTVLSGTQFFGASGVFRGLLSLLGEFCPELLVIKVAAAFSA